MQAIALSYPLEILRRPNNEEAGDINMFPIQETPGYSGLLLAFNTHPMHVLRSHIASCNLTCKLPDLRESGNQ